MKVILEIQIKKVNHVIVNEELIEKHPEVEKSMEKFAKDLISHLKAFYTKNKIDTNIKFKIIENE